MQLSGIHIDHLPPLVRPVLIAGFDGWGNALNVSRGATAYLVKTLAASRFASLDPDSFYRFDENRPLVDIRDAALNGLIPPGGHFYGVQTEGPAHDLVILQADEPGLRWYLFARELYELCRRLAVETVITLGSLYDSVLHSDRIVSGIASHAELREKLTGWGILPISYQGPSAIHSLLLAEGAHYDIANISLWCHCPYYLQGATHYGLLAYLVKLLEKICGFEADTGELEENWDRLSRQVQASIDQSKELQKLVDGIRKEQMKGAASKRHSQPPSDHKVIQITDFLDPK
jgi:proteasome assembly chaperone (PAC2) family protein